MSKERTTADVLAELLSLLPLVRVVARWVFAGLTLHGYLAGRNSDNRVTQPGQAARACVAYADELIAELEKTEGGVS